MAMRILNPGLMTTIQDLGRYGYAHLGVTPAGAADALALRIANLLLGNDENTAALEMTLLGATVEFERAAMVALTGAQVECKLGKAWAPMWKAFPVLPGAVLKCAGKNRKRSPHGSPGITHPAIDLSARKHDNRGALELDRRPEQSHLQRRRVLFVAEQAVGDPKASASAAPAGVTPRCAYPYRPRS